MKKNLAELSKKELKDFINSKGFFCSLEIVQKNEPSDSQKDNVPEGAMYFKGIASTEELNRNGYIIRLEAWKNAIKQFFKEGGVILLQHEMKEPVGKVLSAEVTDKGLEVEGYVFDDLTGGRFSRGLINALSTGHLNLAVEFENKKTKQVVSEKEFRAMPYTEEKYEDWIMAVTKLEWVELSIVSVGANRKSLITTKEVVKNYIESMQTNDEGEEAEQEDAKPEETKVEDTAEVKEEDKPEEVVEEKKPDDWVDPERTEPLNTQQEDEKEAGENPVAVESKAENAIVENSSDLVQISKEELEEMRLSVNQLVDLVKKLQAENRNAKNSRFYSEPKRFNVRLKRC